MISNAGVGVGLTGSNSFGNVLRENKIGTNASASAALPNDVGIRIQGGAHDNQIGLAGFGNIISGNTTAGILVTTSTSINNTIVGNLIGLGSDGSASIPNGYGITADGASQLTIGGNTAAQRNVISNNTFYGISLGFGTNNVTVTGNYLGTDVSGTLDRGNANSGIIVSNGSHDITIGGTANGEGNLVSGNNFGGGIHILGSSNVTIVGNLVGTNATVTAALPNHQGIVIEGDSTGVVVGGTSAAARNIISGSDTGMRISGSGTTNNRVLGNWFGLNAAGNDRINAGNPQAAIRITDGAHHNTIGGRDAQASTAAANFIIPYGLALEISGAGTSNNYISGNFIGQDPTGAAGYGGNGILISGGASLNVVGVDGNENGDAFERNVIASSTIPGRTLITITGASTDQNIVAGNIIGLSSTSGIYQAPGGHGVLVSGGAQRNRIGTDADGHSDSLEANVIAQADAGVRIEGTGTSQNVVAGNYIGMNSTGTVAYTFGVGAVEITDGATNNLVGGSSTASRNFITANRNIDIGVRIHESGTTNNRVQGNIIGLNPAGSAIVGSQPLGTGVYVYNSASGNFIGSDGDGNNDSSEGNVISGILFVGVQVIGANQNTIAGNKIGTNLNGSSAIANNIGISLEGGASQNTIGGVVAGTRNIVSGNTTTGIRITGSGSNSNVIIGNYVGLGSDGTTRIANRADGILITNSAALNRVGTNGDNINDADERNVISGNSNNGINANVNIVSANSNTVAGNYIGTTFDGLSTVTNTGRGVRIATGSANNIIGTNGSNDAFNANERNIVGGISSAAIFIASADSNTVAGNWVGLGPDGTTVLGTLSDGISISGTKSTIVGTNADGIADADEANVLVGSGGTGAVIVSDPGSQNNVVAGNLIGTNATGTAMLGTWQNGIALANTTHDNQIGGIQPAQRNVIAGTSNHGIWVVQYSTFPTAYNNTIQGNYIGLSANGQTDFGVTNSGITIERSYGNLIGGTEPGARNYVSGNGGSGILITGADSYNNTVIGNTVGLNAPKPVNTLSGLVAAYQGNGNGNDVTGNFSATLSGGVSFTQGYLGKAFQFSNDAHAVTVAASSAFDLTNLTLMASIKLDQAPTQPMPILSKGQSGAENFGLYATQQSSGIELTFQYDNGTKQSFTTQSAGLTIGKFYQVAVTVRNNNVRIYVNGVIVGAFLQSVPVVVVPGSLKIGTASPSAGRFKGAIDEIAIFNRGLSGEELLDVTYGGVTRVSNVTGINISSGAHDNIIGQPGAGNVITGNTNGILLSGSGTMNNLVQANIIGLDQTGTARRINTNDGINISGAASNNTIGGATAGSGNIVSGNSGDGIEVTGSTSLGNVIRGNYVGPDIYGSSNLAGAVGFYRADLDASDYVGNGNGTLVGNATRTPSLIGQAFLFDGAGDYITVPPQAIHEVRSQITLDAYINPASFASNAIIIGQESGYQLNLLTTGRLRLILPGVGTFDSTGAVSLSTLQHVAATYSSTEGKVRFYINGFIDSESNASGLITSVNSQVVIGGSTTGQYFTGRIDEPTIYNVALSPAYVQRAFNFVSQGKGIGNAQHGININNVSGTSVIDNVVAGNNGLTLTTSGIVANLANNTIIQGNIVGLDASGSRRLSNVGISGISITNSSNVQLGGTTAAARNISSGNRVLGIILGGASANNNVVEGNYVGVAADGVTAIGNTSDGMRIDTAKNTRVGGSTLAARNIISGNKFDGIDVRNNATGTLIQGNYIGTDSTGSVSVTSGNSGTTVAGAWINSPNVTVADNVIGSMIGFGIQMLVTANNITVRGNRVGTNAAGTVAFPNTRHGIIVQDVSNVTIGGTTPGSGNLVSGNLQDGINITSAASSITVQGNIVGTDVTGTLPLPNQGSGITLFGPNNLIGGSTAGAGNLVSGNANYGIWVIDAAAANNTIQGNRVGTDISGTLDLGNVVDGIRLTNAPNNTIGGTATGAGNLISGNNNYGIGVFGVSTGNTTIAGNLIGTNASGLARIGNTNAGIYVASSTNTTIGGNTSAARNVIAGTTTRGGWYDQGVGIAIVNSNTATIRGNLIGTNINGTQGLGNIYSGITVLDSSNITIGGSLSGQGNVISDNGQYGIVGYGANQVTIQGNRIGTNKAGTASLANGLVAPGGDGIMFFNSSNFTIGGASSWDSGELAGAGNLISDNRGYSIQWTNSSNLILAGNVIGLDITGTRDISVANSLRLGGTGLIIGGTSAALRNIISGNDNGIGLDDADGAIIQGNYIGTDRTGQFAIGNDGTGIYVSGSTVEQLTTGAIIGGAAPGAGNLISGNANEGIYLGTTDNQVIGNFIGTNSSGSTAIPNGKGITVTGTNNVIGGSAPGSRNLISGNTGVGIELTGNNELPGAIATWKAEGNANDVTSTHPGTQFGGAGYAFGLAGGQAFSLDGINDYLAFADEPQLSRDQRSLSIELWINPNTIGGGGLIDKSIDNSSIDYRLSLLPDGRISFVTRNGLDSVVGPVINANVWTHIAAVKDLAANQLRLYINGALVASSSAASAATSIATTDLLMGASRNSSGNVSTFFAGKIDEPAIYARVLTANEISLIRSLGGVAKGRNTVDGNVIGLSSTGINTLPNGAHGVLVSDSPSNIIGGVAGNTISGNRGSGVRVDGASMGTNITGNIIGLDTAGTNDAGNEAYGIFASNVASPIIVNNTISGNDSGGIRLSGTDEALVQNNRIGTNISASDDVGNGGVQSINERFGLWLHATTNAVVGGTSASERNIISGNYGQGLLISDGSAFNMIQGNYLGVDGTGLLPIGNTRDAIRMTGNTTVYNFIGGLSDGASNIIAYSGQSGLRLEDNTSTTNSHNEFEGNDLRGNVGLAVDIGAFGPTANDGNDTGNDLRDYPVVSEATIDGTQLILKGFSQPAVASASTLHHPPSVVAV